MLPLGTIRKNEEKPGNDFLNTVLRLSQQHEREMKKETIYHPDMRDTVFGNGATSPRLSHITVEHSDPLDFSPNPIIQKLIEAGWEVHTTFSQFWFAMPRNSLMLGTPFVFQERHEFEISIKDVGSLRFRFEELTRIYLTLFMVDYEKQGKGLGRVWFPRVTDALFRAGVKYMWGKVEPPFLRTRSMLISR